MKKFKIVLIVLTLALFIGGINFTFADRFSFKPLEKENFVAVAATEDDSTTDELDSQNPTITFVGENNQTFVTSYVAGEGLEFSEITDTVYTALMEKYGYDFKGWFTEENGGGAQYSSIDASEIDNITLYAYFTAHSYSITYVTDSQFDGKFVNENPRSYTIEDGNDEGKIILKSLIISGYDFAWYDSDDEETRNQVTYIVPSQLAEDNQLGELTLYGVFSTKTYSVTITANDFNLGSLSVGSLNYSEAYITNFEYGTPISSSGDVITIGSGDNAIQIIAIASSKATFSAWSNLTTTTIKNNLTISANFVANEAVYTITFDEDFISCYYKSESTEVYTSVRSGNSISTVSEIITIKLVIDRIKDHHYLESLMIYGENILTWEDDGNYTATYEFELTDDLNIILNQKLDFYEISFDVSDSDHATINIIDGENQIVEQGTEISVNLNYGSKIIIDENNLLTFYNAVDDSDEFETYTIEFEFSSSFQYLYLINSWSSESIEILTEEFNNFVYTAEIGYEIKSYTINFDGEFVQVSVDGNGIESGTSVPYGTAIVVSYSLLEHYEINEFYLVDNNLNQNKLNLTENESVQITGDTTIYFSQQVERFVVSFDDRITVSCDGQSINSGDRVAYGETLQFTYAELSHRTISSLLVNGEDCLYVDGELQTSFEIEVFEAVTIKSVYILETFEITFSVANNELGEVSTNKLEVNYGSKIYFNEKNIIVENIGDDGEIILTHTIFVNLANSDAQYYYFVESWSEAEVDFVESDLVYTATIGRATQKYSLTFDAEKVSVFAGGERISSGDELEYGETFTVTYVCDEGYEKKELYFTIGANTERNTIEEDSSYIVLGDINIVLTVKLIDYELVSGEVENGSISLSGETATMGETVYLTVTPNRLYEFDYAYYKAGEEKVVIIDLSFEMPSAPVTVYAIFKKVAVEVTNSNLGVRVVFDMSELNGESEENLSTSIDELSGEELNTIEAKLPNYKVTAFDVNIKLHGEDLKTEHGFTLAIALPNNTNSERVGIYFYNIEEGTLTKLSASIVDDENSIKYIQANVNSVGYYVVAELQTAASDLFVNPSAGTNISTIILVVCGCFAGVLVVCAIVLIVKKHRRRY